jgi:hypothetical protein
MPAVVNEKALEQPMTAQPHLRPLSITDILDAAFRLYRSHFLPFIGIVALLQIPITILQAAVQWILGGRAMLDLIQFSRRPPVPTPGQSIFDTFPFAAFVTLYVVTLSVGIVQYLVVNTLISGALSRAISASYMGKAISILESYGMGWRRFLSLVVASLVPLLLSLVVIVPIVACIFGGVFVLSSGNEQANVFAGIAGVLGAFAFAAVVTILLFVLYLRFLLGTQIIVLEGAGPIEGLRRSWDLTKGGFWRTFCLVLLMGIIVYFVSGLPGSMVSFALSFASGDDISQLMRNQAITLFVTQIGQIIALPLQFAVFTLLYYDQRVRKEGYDIELRAQQAVES